MLQSHIAEGEHWKEKISGAITAIKAPQSYLGYKRKQSFSIPNIVEDITPWISCRITNLM